MGRGRTNYGARFSFMGPMEMWYELEAYVRLRQLDGKSSVIRHAINEFLRYTKGKMTPEEATLFQTILDNIRQPATIEEIAK